MASKIAHHSDTRLPDPAASTRPTGSSCPSPMPAAVLTDAASEDLISALDAEIMTLMCDR